ncbi:MAG TPA: hypothetical protein ENJ19_01000 [Gammaproteobacteria bacterium]|nr:hypothetical protein [Gammaproteobacteria bacterium]
MSLNRMVAIALVVAVLSGCAKVLVKADTDPNADLSKLTSFYVRKSETDKRDLAEKIAAQLKKYGYRVVSAEAAQNRQTADAVVTYVDRWVWDMTTYMLELNVQFRDPDTDFVFASGTSYRTSLARKPPEYMIEEVLSKMLGRPFPSDSGHSGNGE